jgi:hypothetical protein
LEAIANELLYDPRYWDTWKYVRANYFWHENDEKC